jgi:hypothetical protein
VKRIDVLPDDVLLEIFDFYVGMSLSYGGKTGTEAWQSLVHVCRRWRNLVFESPRRLNLRLCCTPTTPAKDKLDVWPAFPLSIKGEMSESGTDNVSAALGQSSRVYKVILKDLSDWQLEGILAAMQVPFPELTNLQLFSEDDTPVIPNSFLGGSAPRLRYFTLDGIPFPGLPKLLLSATHLVRLWLENIPHSGYISPEAMVAPLSALSSLEILSLGFESLSSAPWEQSWEGQILPRPKRSILPALVKFYFSGVTVYLEDLLTRIDTPQLHYMNIFFIEFDTPRFSQFINCTPTLRALDEAHVQFYHYPDVITFRYRTSEFRFDKLVILISYSDPDWQRSFVTACDLSLHSLFTVEDLYIHPYDLRLVPKNDSIENTQWLELLLPFTAVKNLYLSKEFAPGIVTALQELVGDRITEVLPSLQNILVEGLRVETPGHFQENIRQFVAARQLSDHPITLSDWDRLPHEVDVMQPVSYSACSLAFTFILYHSSLARKGLLIQYSIRLASCFFRSCLGNNEPKTQMKGL